MSGAATRAALPFLAIVVPLANYNTVIIRKAKRQEQTLSSCVVREIMWTCIHFEVRNSKAGKHTYTAKTF